MSGYLGNGCYGDEKMFSISKYSNDWGKCAGKVHNGWKQTPEIPVAMETNMLPW